MEFLSFHRSSCVPAPNPGYLCRWLRLEQSERWEAAAWTGTDLKIKKEQPLISG